MPLLTLHMVKDVDGARLARDFTSQKEEMEMYADVAARKLGVEKIQQKRSTR